MRPRRPVCWAPCGRPGRAAPPGRLESCTGSLALRADPPDSYLTCAREGTAEIRVQRSRFLAVCRRVPDPEAAGAFLDEVRRAHHDARHVCWAWRLGVGTSLTEKRQDDGEPAGSAGEPILAALRRADLTDASVAVARWFGGVKLGTGGLGRAYGTAADEAVRDAGVREVLLGRRFVLRLPYAARKTVTRLVEDRGGRVTEQEYGAEITLRLWLPHSAWRGFADALTEISQGALRLDPDDEG